MKRILKIFAAMISAAAVSMTAFAESALEDCRAFESFFDSDELAVVIEQTSDDFYMKEIGYTAANVYSSKNIGEYKEYRALGADFLERLANGTSVKELISDECTWIIPSGKYTAEVSLNNEGEWHTDRIGWFSEELIESGAILDDCVRFDQVDLAIKRIGSNIEDVICVNMPTKYSKFVCLVSDTTYVIPFSPRPDFTGLENGKLYTASEANKIWSDNIGSNISAHNAEIINGRSIDDLSIDELLSLEYHGVGAKNAAETAVPLENNKIPLLLIIIIPAAVIAAAITVMLLVWDRSGKKHSK